MLLMNFKYWFRHWLAYQCVAIKLRAWKPKYLLHDAEKPWMQIFMKPGKVQRWHRTHRKHHVEYGNLEKVDWEAAVIDWECARYTKLDKPLNARETMEQYYSQYESYIIPVLKKFGL